VTVLLLSPSPLATICRYDRQNRKNRFYPHARAEDSVSLQPMQALSIRNCVATMEYSPLASIRCQQLVSTVPSGFTKGLYAF
jgi:hypothetical protein